MIKVWMTDIQRSPSTQEIKLSSDSLENEREPLENAEQHEAHSVGSESVIQEHVHERPSQAGVDNGASGVEEFSQFRSMLQSSFLSYRSPNTTPKQYINHVQLLESFKDLSEAIGDPKTFSFPSRNCACNKSLPSAKKSEAVSPCKTSSQSQSSSLRCECEGVHGMLEMHEDGPSQKGVKVRCMIRKHQGKMTLGIFNGNYLASEMGYILLEEAYVTSHLERPHMFAIGLCSAAGQFLTDSEIYFFCKTSRSRDKWVEALIKAGCRGKSFFPRISKTQSLNDRTKSRRSVQFHRGTSSCRTKGIPKFKPFKCNRSGGPSRDPRGPAGRRPAGLSLGPRLPAASLAGRSSHFK
eukprot:759139-Hanusia_phi.AAC.1